MFYRHFFKKCFQFPLTANSFNITLPHLTENDFIYMISCNHFLHIYPVCAMAVRNCLECQQAHFKHGTEGTAHSYSAMPSTSTSAFAQASKPNQPHVILNIPFSSTAVLIINTKLGISVIPLFLYHFGKINLCLPFSHTQL